MTSQRGARKKLNCEWKKGGGKFTLEDGKFDGRQIWDNHAQKENMEDNYVREPICSLRNFFISMDEDYFIKIRIT
jgi:hypothetical protein